jgi:trans-aconitate methyltransferase
MSRGASQTVVWDPADYAANSSAQTDWAREQIARLQLQGDERILDVGCGDGKITAELASRVPRGSVVGVDNSREMIEFARATFLRQSNPNLEFRGMDARRLSFSETFDLVFSNATLHWVDDHLSFLRGVAGCLRPGGRLVVSCGGRGNAQEVFAVLRGRMRARRWRAYFRRIQTPYFFFRPEEYARWLERCGYRVLAIRLVQKVTAFPKQTLVAWLRTTWLPYTQRVPETIRAEFIGDIASHYVTEHPVDANGHTQLRMVRLELDASRL